MKYKFEKLEVWNLAVEFCDISYQIADYLPDNEKFNLCSQIKRASTSIALNIAEGSTGQSNAEQARFLSYAIRSHIEVIACVKLMQSRNYITGSEESIRKFETMGAKLFSKLQAFKQALT